MTIGAELIEKIDTLVASINEAHRAKSEDWKQACFDAADRVLNEIKGIVAFLDTPPPAQAQECPFTSWDAPVGYSSREASCWSRGCGHGWNAALARQQDKK